MGKILDQKILDQDDKLLKVLKSKGLGICINGTDHSWVLAPVTDLSLSFLCSVCDKPTRVTMVDSLHYDKVNP